MSVTAEPLMIDVDASAFLALHAAVDESVSDQLLDQRELSVRQQTRTVVAHEVAPRTAATDRTHAFAQDSYQALANAGLSGLLFPEDLGGSDDTHVAYAVAMEEIAAGCAATSLVYMTQMHAAYPIWKAGGHDLAAHYLPRLSSGELYGALAITEPDAGSDVASMRTRAMARRSADSTDAADEVVGYSISGAKTFITTGDRADVIVCFATVDLRLGRRGITAFVVDGANPGLTRGRPFVKMGMHGSSTAELAFSDAEIPFRHRLGEEGDGWRLLMSSVVQSRISAAAQGVGIARAAYVRSLAALHRIHDGRLPEEAKSTLADLRGQIVRGRLLLLTTAREVDRSSVSPGQIGLMKQGCTNLGWRVSVAAASLLGPFGDLADLGVERCLRDAKVTQIYDGTNEVQRLLIARDTANKLQEAL